MVRLVAVVALMAILCLAAGPVLANDGADLVASPGSEVARFAGEVWAFMLDTLESADGVTIERIGGNVADATATCLHGEWKPLEQVTILGSFGLTTSIGGEVKTQPVGGATVTIGNAKGNKLAVGVRLTSRDISSKRVPLPDGTPLSCRYALTFGMYRDL